MLQNVYVACQQTIQIKTLAAVNNRTRGLQKIVMISNVWRLFENMGLITKFLTQRVYYYHRPPLCSFKLYSASQSCCIN